jgi:hypothetical protein
MQRIVFTVSFEPGKSFLGSIECRALCAGMKPPVITVEPCKVMTDWYTVVLTIPDEDRMFWLGFFEGQTFVRLNYKTFYPDAS